MKIFPSTLVYAAILIIALSCSKEPNNVTSGCDYFPLQVQNSWEFEHSSKTTVTATRLLDGKNYYEFVTGTDTAYYRKENNKVYTRSTHENEALIFDLNARENQSWQYNSWRVTMSSKNDTIVINHAKIPNCYRFFFDIPGAVDDEHLVWLAPGIGFIRKSCGFCPYPIDNLSKARINYMEISFP
jgi:hypothetical protein